MDLLKLNYDKLLLQYAYKDNFMRKVGAREGEYVWGGGAGEGKKEDLLKADIL